MNPVLLYLLIALGGACTVGAQNIANPYISEYYPKEIRATGIGWALGVGRTRSDHCAFAVCIDPCFRHGAEAGFHGVRDPECFCCTGHHARPRNTLHLILSLSRKAPGIH